MQKIKSTIRKMSKNNFKIILNYFFNKYNNVINTILRSLNPLYFKLRILQRVIKGYTLIEMVVVIAIFVIMGTVMFTGMPSLGKYTRFQKDMILFTDTVRDLQIKGGSVYVKNIDNNNLGDVDDIKGFGMYLDLSVINGNKQITIFKDLESGDVNKYGVRESNAKYDSVAEKVEVDVLEYTTINKIYYNDCTNVCQLKSANKASVAFIRPDITPYIKVEKLDSNGQILWEDPKSNLYIELYFPSLSQREAYKCISVEQSGQTSVVNDKCKS